MKNYLFSLCLSCFVFSAYSTLMAIDNCTGAISCDITNTLPTLVEALPNGDFLGLPTVNYNDFGLRGLDAGDSTFFNGVLT